MNDLFEREQDILDQATGHLKDIKKGAPCDSMEFAFLVKEYGRVLRQLRRLTRMADRTTGDLNSSKQALLDEVRYDALTGIYNRRYMQETLNKVVKTLFRSSQAQLSVIMIDVDHFKKYNDTYGHLMGDECLKTVASALKNSLARDDDFVARYGGEEFAVILPNTDEAGSIIVAERLLEKVRAAQLPHAKNDAADYVTISIGVTSGPVDSHSCDRDFLQKADEALYQSKRNGRNQYTYQPYRGNNNHD